MPGSRPTDERERRAAPRTSTSLRAEVIMPGHVPCAGTIADISASGTFFRPADPPPASSGMHGVLSVVDPIARFDAVVRVARVAEGEPKSGLGLGLQFLTLSNSTRAALARVTAGPN